MFLSVLLVYKPKPLALLDLRAAIWLAVKYIVDREIAKEQEEEFAALPQIQKDIKELSQISGYLDKKISLIKEDK